METTADQVPVNPTSGQPRDGGSETTQPLSLIAAWQSASRRVNPTRSFRPAARAFFWIMVVIAGIVVVAATYPTLLASSGQPLVIYNPHVQR